MSYPNYQKLDSSQSWMLGVGIGLSSYQRHLLTSLHLILHLVVIGILDSLLDSSRHDEFQRKIDECYEGLDGVVALVYDLLVFGQTREEHDRNLRKVLIRSKERCVKINKDKLEVGVTKVKYFGHLLTSEGVGPDPDKVSAVREMKPPKDKSELETFLGMVTYLAKFAPK